MSEGSGGATHQARGVAESFGGDAERYDRTRPPYPDELVDLVVSRAPGRRFLDVGTGTGILARQLTERGVEVLGVEPDERMAETARRHGLAVEVGTVEQWEPRERVFDAVVAGQAWHWVDPEAGPTKVGSVLVPGGVLALLAHVYEPPATVQEAGMSALAQVAPDSPFVRSARGTSGSADGVLAAYRKGYETFAGDIRRSGLFAEPEVREVAWERAYSRAEWLDLVPTMGLFTQLPADGLQQVTGAIGTAIDDLGGSVDVRFTTLALLATRS